jgi:alpha/beta superfamily hydrolase
MIANTFNALGVGTVRFNFRGVGRSTGHYDHGNGETEDLAAVVKWLRTEWAPSELWLAGFSFGSYVALRAHQELKASRLLLVAPAVDKLDFSGLQLSQIPTLLIQGERDDVVSPQAVLEWVATQPYFPQIEWLPEADHFFHGQLNVLREVILKAWR